MKNPNKSQSRKFFAEWNTLTLEIPKAAAMRQYWATGLRCMHKKKQTARLHSIRGPDRQAWQT